MYLSILKARTPRQPTTNGRRLSCIASIVQGYVLDDAEKMLQDVVCGSAKSSWVVAVVVVMVSGKPAARKREDTTGRGVASDHDLTWLDRLPPSIGSQYPCSQLPNTCTRLSLLLRRDLKQALRAPRSLASTIDIACVVLSHWGMKAVHSRAPDQARCYIDEQSAAAYPPPSFSTFARCTALL